MPLPKAHHRNRNRTRTRAAPRLRRLGSLFYNAAIEWRSDNALRLSAAVSFYAVLSLAPLLALVIRVMGFVHARQFARRELIQQITRLMGPQAAGAIEPIISAGPNRGSGYLATAISTGVLLFSATSVFIELKDSMNSLWGVQFTPHKTNPAKHAVLTFIRARLLSLAMVCGLGLLLVSSMFVSGLFTALSQQIAYVGPISAHLAAIAISVVIEFAIFAALFKLLPDLIVRWSNVWLGALIAAILFSAGRFGLGIYFNYARNDNAYGAAGSLVAVLTWIYYSCFSLFYGAEFTKVWTRR